MGTHQKSMQTECFTMLLLAFLANAVASDDHKAASWLTNMLTNSNVELKRNGESVNANPEFWGVRGKRSSEGVDTYLLDDTESKRALKPNSLFGSISKKMLKPNSLFNTVEEKSEAKLVVQHNGEKNSQAKLVVWILREKVSEAKLSF